MNRLATIDTVSADFTVNHRASAARDSRWENRQKSSMPAMVMMSDGSAALSCKIMDQSSAGAMIELAPRLSGKAVTADNLPATFRLYIPLDRVEVDCAVAWHRGNRAGLRFVSQMRPVKQQMRRSSKKQLTKQKTFFGWGGR